MPRVGDVFHLTNSNNTFIGIFMQLVLCIFFFARFLGFLARRKSWSGDSSCEASFTCRKSPQKRETQKFVGFCHVKPPLMGWVTRHVFTIPKKVVPFHKKNCQRGVSFTGRKSTQKGEFQKQRLTHVIHIFKHEDDFGISRGPKPPSMPPFSPPRNGRPY